MITPKIGKIKSGASETKNTSIIVFDFDDIEKSNWPSRDAGKIKMVGNIPFLAGKYIQEIYGTSTSISLPKTSEGDEDAVAVSSNPEFSHPGSPLVVEEFLAKYTNRSVGLAVQVVGCDGEPPFYRIFGSPYQPLTLRFESQNNNEATKDMMKFEQSAKSTCLPGRYYGTWTKAVANAVAADAVVIDVAAGSGEYQLADNALATTITDITNPVHNEVYTVKGSGGANPATIEAANVKFLIGAVDWQGLAGAMLTVKAFDNGGSFVFIEQSRS